MFIYNPLLLCIGSPAEIAFAAVTAISGDFLLIYPGLWNSIAWIGIFGGVGLWQWATRSRVVQPVGVQPATVLQKGIERKSAVADTDRHEERGFPQ